MASFNTVFSGIIKDIQEFGTVAQPRSLKVSELAPFSVALDPTNVFADFTARPMNFKYLAGEFAWYMQRDTDIDYINQFSAFWKGITNPGTNEINSNYGRLLFGEQLQWALDSLIKDKWSRQAIAFVNRPQFQFEGNKDFVCTMYLNFWIRDNKLNMKVQMRSNDIFYGLTYDAPFFGFVHQHMLLWLKSTYPDLELGHYYHHADNIHFYEQHFELADKILSEPEGKNTYIMDIQAPFFTLEAGQMQLTRLGKDFMSTVDKMIKDSTTVKEDWFELIDTFILQ